MLNPSYSPSTFYDIELENSTLPRCLIIKKNHEKTNSATPIVPTVKIFNMASFFRLGSRQILNQVLMSQRVGMLSLVRPLTLKAQPACPPKEMGHDERNMKIGRPQSPHLSIYAPQWTSMLSISHRATGMILAFYTIMWGLGAIVLPDTIPCYLEQLQESSPNEILMLGTKFVLAFPLTYHFWNGIRHLMWDMGLFLNLGEVYATGYLMLILAIGSAVALVNM